MNIEETHLGKQSSYPQTYDPSVLVAVPRYLNREQYQIDEQNLPFQGVDAWHAYEFSFLTNNGLPVVGVLKIVYSCTNEFLVESKSLKLFLNSFNMERIGDTRNDGIQQVIAIIKKDLYELLKCDIQISYFDAEVQPSPFDFIGYQILENEISEDELLINSYSEDINLLKKVESDETIQWGSHLLRSNCKITNQPDWGSLYLQMKGNQHPTKESFLKYLVSLRNENHFHEEICEMVFKRLIDIFNPEQLLVVCLYTRRGGIDICPVRYLQAPDQKLNLMNQDVFDTPSFRQ